MSRADFIFFNQSLYFIKKLSIDQNKLFFIIIFSFSVETYLDKAEISGQCLEYTEPETPQLTTGGKRGKSTLKSLLHLIQTCPFSRRYIVQLPAWGISIGIDAFFLQIQVQEAQILKEYPHKWIIYWGNNLKSLWQMKPLAWSLAVSGHTDCPLHTPNHVILWYRKGSPKYPKKTPKTEQKKKNQTDRTVVGWGQRNQLQPETIHQRHSQLLLTPLESPKEF